MGSHPFAPAPFPSHLNVCSGDYDPVGKPERRQQILAVDRDIFARRGYHAARIDEMVAAAGIARGTFYLYFDDKRAIFEEIVDRTIARLGLSIVRVDPNDGARTVADQVRDNIRRIVRILLEDRATTKILLSDALGVDPAFDRKLLSFYDEMSSLLEQSLRDGQALVVVAPRMPAVAEAQGRSGATPKARRSEAHAEAGLLMTTLHVRVGRVQVFAGPGQPVGMIHQRLGRLRMPPRPSHEGIGRRAMMFCNLVQVFPTAMRKDEHVDVVALVLDRPRDKLVCPVGVLRIPLEKDAGSLRVGFDPLAERPRSLGLLLC